MKRKYFIAKKGKRTLPLVKFKKGIIWSGWKILRYEFKLGDRNNIELVNEKINKEIVNNPIVNKKQSEELINKYENFLQKLDNLEKQSIKYTPKNSQPINRQYAYLNYNNLYLPLIKFKGFFNWGDWKIITVKDAHEIDSIDTSENKKLPKTYPYIFHKINVKEGNSFILNNSYFTPEECKSVINDCEDKIIDESSELVIQKYEFNTRHNKLKKILKL